MELPEVVSQLGDFIVKFDLSEILLVNVKDPETALENLVQVSFGSKGRETRNWDIMELVKDFKAVCGDFGLNHEEFWVVLSRVAVPHRNVLEKGHWDLRKDKNRLEDLHVLEWNILDLDGVRRSFIFVQSSRVK